MHGENKTCLRFSPGWIEKMTYMLHLNATASIAPPPQHFQIHRVPTPAKSTTGNKLPVMHVMHETEIIWGYRRCGRMAQPSSMAILLHLNKTIQHPKLNILSPNFINAFLALVETQLRFYFWGYSWYFWNSHGCLLCRSADVLAEITEGYRKQTWLVECTEKKAHAQTPCYCFYSQLYPISYR